MIIVHLNTTFIRWRLKCRINIYTGYFVAEYFSEDMLTYRVRGQNCNGTSVDSITYYTDTNNTNRQYAPRTKAE